MIDVCKGYLLDTNIFNSVAKEKIPLGAFSGLDLFATHVQHDELSQTSDLALRARLLSSFHELGPSALPTKTFNLDVSRTGVVRTSEHYQRPIHGKPTP